MNGRVVREPVCGKTDGPRACRQAEEKKANMAENTHSPVEQAGAVGGGGAPGAQATTPWLRSTVQNATFARSCVHLA